MRSRPVPIAVLPRAGAAGGGFRLLRGDVVAPGLEESHDGIRIAHLTDLHVGLLTPTKRLRLAVERANAEQPDLTLLTGDFLCYGKSFVPLLGEIVREIKGPVVAVLGNHDYYAGAEAARKQLERVGVAVLRNQHTTITLAGRPLELVGIDDAITGHADPARAFRGTRARRSRLVLTHVPTMADHAALHGPSLVLAGHTHGGHINIPKLTAAIGRRLGNRYLAGFYRVGSSLLYVNRGVGSSTVPFRANAPAEVAVVTLRRPPQSGAPEIPHLIY